MKVDNDRNCLKPEVLKFIHPNVTDLSIGSKAGFEPILTHCAHCGKEIYIPVPHDWVYKIKIRKKNKAKTHLYYCSYSHYLEGEKNICTKVKGYIWS